MFTNASKTASNDTIDNNLQLSVWTLYIHDYAMNHKNKQIYSNREKHTTSKKNYLRIWAGNIRQQQLSVSCHRCYNFRHCFQTRSAAVCQFAQYTAAATIIQSAAASTDTALV